MQQYYKIKIILFGETNNLVLEKQDTTSKVFQVLQAQKENVENLQNKKFKFFVPVLNRFVNIDETKLEDILGNTESWSFELKEDQSQIKQTNKQGLNSSIKFSQIKKEILSKAKSVYEQIDILYKELKQLDNDNDLTNNQKQYLKHQYQQYLIAKLKDYGEAKSIPHVQQKIDVSNPEVALFVLKESLLRDQNIELLATSKLYSFGIDSILGSYGQDQTCLKVRNTNLDYDKIVNDQNLLEKHLLEFIEQLSSSLKISTDQIEILGVSKGSFEINFNITGTDMNLVEQQIQNNPTAKKFLNEYCNGKVEYVAYFDKARVDAYQTGDQMLRYALSSDDFNPQFNMNWDGFHEKEQRGPSYHRYDYYFPRGCYGFGLNVRKYDNNDWVKMDGNPNEWRIMYHGTKNIAVNAIIRNNLQPGQTNRYAQDQCLNEFGKTVMVGDGIYFSDKIDVCIRDKYASYVDVGDKQIAAIFMSRVNPKKIRQSKNMKSLNYFVVNKSQDVRIYRLLLHEKKDIETYDSTCALY